jgi:hypothetical protein
MATTFLIHMRRRLPVVKRSLRGQSSDAVSSDRINNSSAAESGMKSLQ